VSKRLGGLAEVDPLLVPLQHGTEVTTRVERTAVGRRVPQGLVGRVVRERDGGFDVLITGVGELWYARNELAPRKAGQIEFALRRDRASAKKLLYVLRTRLLDRYGLSEVTALVEQKRRGERSELPGALRVQWASRVGEVFALLDRAAAESALPAESPNAEEIEAWLIEARLRWMRRESVLVRD
jgi:hypothetical protein